MGYTHYWTMVKEWTPSDFANFKTDASKLMAISNVPIEVTEHRALPGELVFNGVGPDSFETFQIDLGQGSNFCKTARRPYDEVVTAVLICAKYHFRHAIEIRSDGSWDEWRDGRELYQTTFPHRDIWKSPLGNKMGGK